MIPYFTTESDKGYSITVMEVTTKYRKLVVPQKSLKKFIEEDYFKSIGQKDFYDFDEAKKYNEQNILLIHYQNHLSEKSIIDDELYKNFDFIEVNNVHYIKLNYLNEWFENLKSRSISETGILYKKWGNYFISNKGIDLLQEAEVNGLAPF